MKVESEGSAELGLSAGPPEPSCFQSPKGPLKEVLGVPLGFGVPCGLIQGRFRVLISGT